MITKYNHRRTRESAGLSVNRMLLCDLPRAHRPPHASALLPFLPPSTPHHAAYILYQTHPSVRPLKHIAARKIRIDHETSNVYTHSTRVHGKGEGGEGFIETCTKAHGIDVDCTGRSVSSNKSVPSVLHIYVTCIPVAALHVYNPPTTSVFLRASFFCSPRAWAATKGIARYRGHCDRELHVCAL